MEVKKKRQKVLFCFEMTVIVFISLGYIFLSLQVPKDMKKPIYVYYQLDRFYQNHRW